MRWDNLFDDIESQLEQELGAEEIDLIAEEERLRLGRLDLRDRLRAMTSAQPTEAIRMVLADGARVAVTVGAIGRDWIAGELDSETNRSPSCVIPIAAVVGCLPTSPQIVASLGAHDDPAYGALAARLGLPFVLRDLCRRRAALHVVTRTDRVHGTIDRVGRDHFDLAEHEPGAARRERDVRAIRIVPVAELVSVRF